MTTITVFKGDGIGPEITDAVIKVLNAAGADLEYEFFNVGAKIYEETKRGTLAELEQYYNEHPPKGEFVIIIEGNKNVENIENKLNLLEVIESNIML